jgi:AraC-like DNA-binding protein
LGDGQRFLPMQIPFDFVNIIHLAAIILGIASGLVILYFGIKHKTGNLPLAFGQITLATAIWVSFAIVSKLVVHWPFLFRMGNFFGLLFVPLPFLYVRYYTQKRSFKWYDSLHFIPALIYLVDFWPIFSLSNQQKLSLILQEINDPNLYAQLRESRFFGPGFHQTFRTILFSLYWLVQCRMLYLWVKKQPKLSYKDRVWKNWVITYLFFQAGLWLPLYLTFIWIDKSLTYHMVNTAGATWLVLSSILLFLYPSLLHGQQPYKEPGKSRKPKPVVSENGHSEDPQNPKLEDIKRVIDQGLDNDHLFLKPGLTIHEFSKDIGIPMYQISKCIAHYTDLGFIDLINQKRIQYCTQKLDAGKWKNFTIEAIAHECGFNNRNSFTNAFKKFKEVYPSDYKAGLDAFSAAT